MLDTAFQRKVLEILRPLFPLPIDNEGIPKELTADEHKWHANIHYLYQHGLISMVPAGEWGVQFDEIFDLTITAKGIDYIAEDGGLTNYYGSINIRLDDGLIKNLIKENIEKSSVDPKQKSKMNALLKTVSSSALSEIVKQSISAAFSNGPDIIHRLQSML